MKISVTLVTRNRRDDIVNTINHYNLQNYDDFEIILIDNGSTDGTKELIPSLFPEVRYLWLSDNFEMKSMNIAFSMATGDVFWRGDDDSFPESNDCFSNIAKILQNNDDIDMIASEDLEMGSGGTIWHWFGKEVDKENIPEKGYVSERFHGTGVGIRRRVWEKIGGFWGWGFEELDFSLKALNEGFNIRYFPNIRTLHYSANENRRTPWRWLNYFTKQIRIVWKYLPFCSAIGKSILIFANQLFAAIYQRISFFVIIEGLISSLGIAMKTRREEYVKLNPEVLKIAKNSINGASYIRFYKNVLSRKLKKFRGK